MTEKPKPMSQEEIELMRRADGEYSVAIPRLIATIDQLRQEKPTAIHPSIDELWNTHKSLPFECDDQDCMTLDGFKAALNEAELRERWEYWSAKCAELTQQVSTYCAEICELHNQRGAL